MDQEDAELYYMRYGSWPMWSGLTGLGAIRSLPVAVPAAVPASTSLLAGARLIAPTTLLAGSPLGLNTLNAWNTRALLL